MELTEWQAVWKIRAYEQEQAMNEARNG